jgi:hypothetical protein
VTIVHTTEPTHCGLWIMWRGLQCEAALGVVHLEETTLQIVPIHEDCVVVEVSLYILSLRMNCWNTLLMKR